MASAKIMLKLSVTGENPKNKHIIIIIEGEGRLDEVIDTNGHSHCLTKYLGTLIKLPMVAN